MANEIYLTSGISGLFGKNIEDMLIDQTSHNRDFRRRTDMQGTNILQSMSLTIRIATRIPMVHLIRGDQSLVLIIIVVPRIVISILQFRLGKDRATMCSTVGVGICNFAMTAGGDG